MEDYFILEMAYNILLKEYQISSLQEIPYDMYQRLSITTGIKTARYYVLYGDTYGIVKSDGTYRQLWNSLLNSN